MDTLWILCPVYRDVESFLQLRGRLGAVIADTPELAGLKVEYVVVDDTAGVDQEIDRLCEMDATTVLQPPFNLGHQRAIVYGLRRMAGKIQDEDLVVTMDADGEDRPEDLPRIVQSLVNDRAAMRQVVLALRTKRREGFVFKIMYLAFRIAFRLLTGVTIRTGNFAAYRGWIARHVLQHPHFDLCYSSTLNSLNLPLVFVPCERGRRYAGKSRMGYSQLITHGMRMLMPFVDRIAIRSLIVFSLTFALALALAAVVAAIRILTSAAIPGWASLTLLLVLILSFVALGNFVVLFAVFSQSRGISLSNLEQGE